MLKVQLIVFLKGVFLMTSTCGTNSVMHCIVNFPNNTIMVNRDANENNKDAKRQPFGDITTTWLMSPNRA